MLLSKSSMAERRVAFPNSFSLCVLCDLCGKKYLWRIMTEYDAV